MVPPRRACSLVARSRSRSGRSHAPLARRLFRGVACPAALCHKDREAGSRPGPVVATLAASAGCRARCVRGCRATGELAGRDRNTSSQRSVSGGEFRFTDIRAVREDPLGSTSCRALTRYPQRHTAHPNSMALAPATGDISGDSAKVRKQLGRSSRQGVLNKCPERSLGGFGNSADLHDLWGRASASSRIRTNCAQVGQCRLPSKFDHVPRNSWLSLEVHPMAQVSAPTMPRCEDLRQARHEFWVVTLVAEGTAVL